MNEPTAPTATAHGARTPALPSAFMRWICVTAATLQRQPHAKSMWRFINLRLTLWIQEGGAPDSQNALPGYPSPPPSLAATGFPAGWSYDRIRRLLKQDLMAREKLSAHAAARPAPASC